MRSESIVVTSKTNLTELQKFADNLDDGMRLRAKKVDGGYELYAKDSKPGLWSRIFGGSAQTRANAREAIKMVFDNAERSYGGKALDNVRNAIDFGIRSKDVKGQTLKVLVDSVDMQSITRYEYRLENKGPSLDKLPGDLGRKLFDHAESVITKHKNSGEVKLADIANEIAAEWKQEFKTASKDPANGRVLERLALSSGSRMTFELRQQLARDNVVAGSDGIRALLELAFDNAVPELLRNREQSDGKITIDGEAYTRTKNLGKGAFGTVDLYVCDSDPAKKVALKSILTASSDEDADQFRFEAETLKREGNVHLAALGDGNDNVVGFKGAVGMRSGAVAIAVDFAAHGTVGDAVGKIDQAVQDGRISATEAFDMRLGLIHDMTNGLAHINRDGKSFVHFDFKAFNVLIGEGGVGKLADFGLSSKAGKVDLAAVTIPANPLQVAPELKTFGTQADKVRRVANPDKTSNAELKQRIVGDRAGVEARFKGLSDAERQSLLSDVLGGVKINHIRAMIDVSADGIDSWALGYTTFRMLLGRDPFSSQFDSDIEDRLGAFANNPDNRAIDTSVADSSRQDWDTRKTGAFGGRTGNADIDSLINGLLHPDPAKRLTMADAARHPAFANAGSDTSRQKLVAVLEGDWNKLKSLQGGAQQASASAQTTIADQNNMRHWEDTGTV